MRFIRRLFFVAMLAINWISFGPAMAEEPATPLEDVVIQNFDDRHVGWSAGTLEVDLGNSRKNNPLRLVFKSERRGPIKFLTVSSDDWGLDLTTAVRSISHPFPSRISIIPMRHANAFEKFTISLPFRTGSRESGDLLCHELEIAIEHGKLGKRQTVAAPTERCAF